MKGETREETRKEYERRKVRANQEREDGREEPPELEEDSEELWEEDPITPGEELTLVVNTQEHVDPFSGFL